jgi:Na+/H+-dicarboxylate symporter
MQKKKLELHWKILIGLVLGIIWAFVSSALGFSRFTINWIGPFGTIFINLLKLIAVPLVLFSVIKGITDLSDTSKLGRLGIKTIALYLSTTLIAITVGLLLVNLIKPGELLSENQRTTNRISYELWVQETTGVEPLDGKNYLANPIYADEINEAQKILQIESANETVKQKMEKASRTKEAPPLQFLVDMVPDNIFASLNSNGLMLQVIFFALFFGITIISLPRSQVSTVISFVEGANDIFLKMVELVMKAAPYFVFALLAGVLAEMAGNSPQNVLEIFKGLAWYSLTVVAGLLFMIFVLYPLLMTIFTFKKSRKSFWQIFRHFNNAMTPAQLMAFSTSSSAATLPVTMKCVNERLGVSKEVSSFVLPIGATVNMDGTSLYQAVAVVFLAQFHIIDLTFVQQLIIVLTATLASIGSAAVPSAGLIMLIIVLQSVGLNPAWIAIIFPVDRILDMCRTVVNVTGDGAVASIVASDEDELNIR